MRRSARSGRTGAPPVLAPRTPSTRADAHPARSYDVTSLTPRKRIFPSLLIGRSREVACIRGLSRSEVYAEGVWNCRRTPSVGSAKISRLTYRWGPSSEVVGRPLYARASGVRSRDG